MAAIQHLVCATSSAAAWVILNGGRGSGVTEHRKDGNRLGSVILVTDDYIGFRITHQIGWRWMQCPETGKWVKFEVRSDLPHPEGLHIEEGRIEYDCELCGSRHVQELQNGQR